MPRTPLALQSVPDAEIAATYAAEWDAGAEPFPGAVPAADVGDRGGRGRDRRPVPRLDQVEVATRPVARADEQALPVLPALAGLVPAAGLPRGIEVAVAAGPGGGALSLALALAAGPAVAGSWVAMVGVPDVGLVAAAELGLPLDRVAVVGPPGPEAWATVVGALVGSVDLVLVAPRHPVAHGDARRLATRRRERGTVVVQVPGAGTGRPGRADHLRTERTLASADLCLAVTSARWAGVGDGHGRLHSRQVRVEASGRGRTARPRRVDLLLPGPDGTVVEVAPADERRDGGARSDEARSGPGRGAHRPVAPLRRVAS